MTTTTTPPAARAVAPAAQPEMDVLALGQVFARSGFFSDASDPAKAVVKILAGRELGLGAMSSMTGIIMVKGRVTFNANTMLAVAVRSGPDGRRQYKHEVTKHDEKGCSIKFLRREGDAWEAVGVSTFTEEDAKRAGLLGGDNYRKYPRNMYFARAASNGCKWYCPDAFCGITPYTPDEVAPEAVMTAEGDFVMPARREEVPVTVEVVPEPGVEGSERNAQLAAVRNLLKRTRTPAARVAQHFGVGRLEDLTDDGLASALQLLQAKASAGNGSHATA